MTQRIALTLLCLLALTACGGESDTPKGRWEGFSESPAWQIAVRLELKKDGEMRASALSALVDGADLPRRHQLEQELKQGIKDQWSAVPKTDIDFNGNTITRKGGYAPIFVYEPGARAMVFHFYAGGKLTEKVTLRPVETFAR
jgi:hypothetical protein